MLKAWRRLMALAGFVWMFITLIGFMYRGITGTASMNYIDYLAGYAEQVIGFLNRADNPWNKNAMGIVFPTLGLAGSVVPAVYGARNRKIKGILIHDVTRYFFPLYGFIMVGNLAMSVAGQVCASMDIFQPLKYFLAGSVLSVVYAAVLILGTGLNERITQWYIQGYISDHISVLKVSARQEQGSKNWLRRRIYCWIRTRRAKFLAALTSHIAEQTAEVKTPYCIIEKSLEKEIRQVIKIITYQTASQNTALKTKYGFTESFDVIFKYTDDSIDPNSCCDCVYYELPASEQVRGVLAGQVESAYEFWQIALGSFQNIGKEAKAACRILYALTFRNGRLYDNYMIMGCGLIVYLYKKYHSASDDSNKHEIERCAMFIDHMTDVFRGEACFLDDPDNGLKDTLRLCTDLLFTVWVIAEAEIYSAPNTYECHQLNETVDRLILGEHGYVSRAILSQNNIAKYLCLGWCLIKKLPSVANKAMTMVQKRVLLDYILQEIKTDRR